MKDRFSRTRILVGDDGVARLAAAHVAVVGVGGVGGYALEALARAGVGHLHIIDGDIIDITNLNRQVLALETNLGRPKVEVARDRVLQINPAAHVDAVRVMLTADNIDEQLPASIGFAVDAIDSVAAKVALIATLYRRGIPFVSSMGTAGNLDPARLRLADISRTGGCPLARTVRRELRSQGIVEGVRCVYSDEPSTTTPERDPETGRHCYGTISYLPGVAGLLAASAIIRDILQNS